MKRKNQGFANKYNYNGNEEMPFTGYLYYGARIMDPSIGRFTSIDPLASDYASWSPYSYTFDNPIRFIDPDGMAPIQGGPGDPPKKVAWDQRVRNRIGGAVTGVGNLIGSLFHGSGDSNDSQYTTPGGTVGSAEDGQNQENHKSENVPDDAELGGVLALAAGMRPGKSKTAIMNSRKLLDPGNLKDITGAVKNFDKVVSFDGRVEKIYDSFEGEEVSTPDEFGTDTVISTETGEAFQREYAPHVGGTKSTKMSVIPIEID